MDKNERTRQTKLRIQKRREFLNCKTFEVKFDKPHLSKKKLHHLKMLFVEAKWLYNYQLSLEDVFDLSYK